MLTYPQNIESVVALCVALHLHPEYSAKLMEWAGHSSHNGQQGIFFLENYYSYAVDEYSAILTAKRLPIPTGTY